MKLVIDSELTCRHAALGDSSTVRAANSLTGVCALRSPRPASHFNTNGPNRFSSASPPAKPPQTMTTMVASEALEVAEFITI